MIDTMESSTDKKKKRDHPIMIKKFFTTVLSLNHMGDTLKTTIQTIQDL